MVELVLPEESAPFVDERPSDSAMRREFIEPGRYDVDQADVDRYLDYGWSRAEDVSMDSDEYTTDSDAELGMDSEDEVSEQPIRLESAEVNPEASLESDGADGELTVEDFSERQWNTVTDDIEEGRADPILAELDQYERNRDSQRDSVLSAVEDRMKTIRDDRDDLPDA